MQLNPAEKRRQEQKKNNTVVDVALCKAAKPRQDEVTGWRCSCYDLKCPWGSLRVAGKGVFVADMRGHVATNDVERSQTAEFFFFPIKLFSGGYSTEILALRNELLALVFGVMWEASE